MLNLLNGWLESLILETGSTLWVCEADEMCVPHDFCILD
jgi:hypothetical protein